MSSERKTVSKYHCAIDLDHGELSDNFAELIAVLNIKLLEIPEDCRSSATWSVSSTNEIDVYYRRPETDDEYAHRLKREEEVRKIQEEERQRIAAKEVINLKKLIEAHPEQAAAYLAEVREGKAP